MTPPPIPVSVTADIVAAGARMDRFGWVPATAGNISHRLDDERIAITRSGVHKGKLEPADVIAVDLDGVPLDPHARPSAETLLHTQLYRLMPALGAVVHGHSVPSTVLSMLEPGNTLTFKGYEILKAFPPHTTHETELTLPIVDNDQDIPRLALKLAPLLPTLQVGYLIRGHGTYTWGSMMEVALARFEALEFLLSCTLERRKQ